MCEIWKTIEKEDYKIEERILQPTESDIKIIGITRIRNEANIIEDTLKHVSQFVDVIIVYDDCSTDNTVSLVKNNSKVIKIIENQKWKQERMQEETLHRQKLLEMAKVYNPEWIFYFDADERCDFSREQIAAIPENVDGIRVRLFDAYMTEHDKASFCSGQPLWGFRTYFGPEYRDILMLFRNRDYIFFEGLDQREPVGCKTIWFQNYCQHYGKALSVEQWEEACNYYSTFFTAQYQAKWHKRRGRAIHAISDFGQPLCTWDEIKEKEMPVREALELLFKDYVQKNQDRNVCIFGAGRVLRGRYDIIEKHAHICAIVDNDERKWGEKFGSVECEDPKTLSEIENPLVLISVDDLVIVEKISMQLADMGVKDVRHLSEWFS